MAPKKPPGQKRRKSEDWDAAAKIQRPPAGCPLEEMKAWLNRMQAQYDLLNKADRVIYQKARKAYNARTSYGTRKDDPVFLAEKCVTQSVSNFFTLHIYSQMNNFKVSYRSC